MPAMNFRGGQPVRSWSTSSMSTVSKALPSKNDEIVIKAMTRHRELELDPDVRRANPLVAEIMQHVAHVPIRNRGTVVGSLCHADPSAEMPLLFVLLDGTLVARGRAGRGKFLRREFFQSFLTTARQQDEIVVEARLAGLAEGRRLGIRRGDTASRRLCHGRRRLRA